jgi:hypothetical protein
MDASWTEVIMPIDLAKFVVKLVAVLVMAALSVGTIRSASADQLGQMGRDTLTNRYEPPHSEVDIEFGWNGEARIGTRPRSLALAECGSKWSGAILALVRGGAT